MGTKNCKYCGAKPENYGLDSFEDNVCPTCTKGKEAISGIVPRKSASADLKKVSPFAKEGDYLVTLVVGVKPFTHYLHYAPFTLGRGSKWAHVTAWMDNPEPYKDEESI